MNVLVLAYGGGDAASTVYRFRACRPLWAEEGHRLDVISVRDLPPDFWQRLKEYDAVVNQKALLPGRFRRRLLSAGPPVFFDFDDAIWMRPGRPYSAVTRWRVEWRLRHWLAGVRGVTTANEVLAAYARRHAARVFVMPMALDLSLWRSRPRVPHDEVRIGWAGSPGNLGSLEQCRTALQAVLARHPRARLAVFCGRRPEINIPLDYVPYAPGGEALFVADLDIGILPLKDEPYSHGKSPIKALQYLSCGVPVVGNVFGATREILDENNSLAVATPTEWETALGRLIEDPALRHRLGQAGRRKVEQNHNLERVARRLREILTAAD